MICKGGDSMYSSKISNSMTIDKKTGEVKLNDVEVRVDGFKEPRLLEKAKENYNADKGLPEIGKYNSKWPEGTWYDMYLKMMKNLLKWKRKKVY